VYPDWHGQASTATLLAGVGHSCAIFLAGLAAGTRREPRRRPLPVAGKRRLLAQPPPTVGTCQDWPPARQPRRLPVRHGHPPARERAQPGPDAAGSGQPGGHGLSLAAVVPCPRASCHAPSSSATGWHRPAGSGRTAVRGTWRSASPARHRSRSRSPRWPRLSSTKGGAAQVKTVERSSIVASWTNSPGAVVHGDRCPTGERPCRSASASRRRGPGPGWLRACPARRCLAPVPAQ
jgi:hypothetical protein